MDGLPAGYFAAMVDRVEDVHPVPGQLPPDLIVDAVQDARPVPRWRQRDTVATVVLVSAVVAALVIPGFLFARGLRETQTIRGVGAGRGVFTAAACGDPKTTVSTDSQGNKTTSVSYTCTGTFHGRSTSLDDVAVSSDVDYQPGVRTAAYVAGADHVRLADNREAAAKMALWFTLACFVAGIEAALIRLLYHRIRGRTGPGNGIDAPLMMALVVMSPLMAAPVLTLVWLASYFTCMGIYAA